MPAEAKHRNLKGFMRPLILLPALVVVLSLTFAGAASARTVSFQASVNDIVQKGQPSAPCPTIYYCGSANIAGYGPAFWSFDESPNVPPTPLGSDCFVYTGTSTFTLLSDSSTLVLNEANFVFCHPGNSGNTPGFWPHAYGHPGDGNGNWTVQEATGQFSGLTGGAGTDTLRTNGARLEATWSGTVNST
jgi:hypothetical protein